MKTFHFHRERRLASPEVPLLQLPMPAETAGEVFHVFRAIEKDEGERHRKAARSLGPLVLPAGFPLAGAVFEMAPGAMEGAPWNRQFRTGRVAVDGALYEATTYFKREGPLRDFDAIDFENPQESFVGSWSVAPDALARVPVEDVNEIIRRTHLIMCVLGEE